MASDTESTPRMGTEDVMKLYNTIQTSVDASVSSSNPLITKLKNNDDSFDFSSGLSLLSIRPQILLSSLHNLVILLSLRLLDPTLPFPTSEELQSTISLSTPFTEPRSRSHANTSSTKGVMNESGGQLILNQEVMDKIRGMESKLDYQIKKLVGLAEAEEKRGNQVIDNIEEDPLSFRPNPSSIATSRERAPKQSKFLNATTSDQSDEEGKGESSNIYRPPRVAAVPYLDSVRGEKKERIRKAPALLSEFAASIDSAPILESTSGLSVRPISNRHITNSTSSKRAEELKRIQEFEESNMTRLVTSKKEEKRRRDDEASLAMGFGVSSSTSRGRRGRNGLEAELEGVLNERGSKGVWDNVTSSLGKRGDALERGKKRLNENSDPKKGKKNFERDLKRRRK
ncbi:uncharacterized protein IL334_000429 [Kwoniella shivajii]|uniref:Uncharacterized protein n=1 Tax=Kwoniella shivajii TaxID=564305 RepID=A0ABZ1CQ62_9TREE|nr:hypothetical protein IL334_000429 [Kwoniella shivajii]